MTYGKPFPILTVKGLFLFPPKCFFGNLLGLCLLDFWLCPRIFDVLAVFSYMVLSIFILLWLSAVYCCSARSAFGLLYILCHVFPANIYWIDFLVFHFTCFFVKIPKVYIWYIIDLGISGIILFYLSLILLLSF